MCDCSLYVTSVTNAGTHISFHAQPNPEQFAVLDRLITQNQAFFEQARLPSPYQLPPGQTVLVKSTSSGAAKWHRARVVGIQGPTVSVEYIDYGTSELAHYTQICASRTALPAAVLTQPPLAVPCVLAEVLPATGTWTEAAFSHAESALRSRQPVQAQVLRQDTDGVWHVRVYTGDGRTLASQLAALGMGRLTTPSGQYPVQAACSPLAPASRGPEPPLAFATRVSELLSVPPLSGSEALVTICHYINGPAKFAVQLYEHQPALLQLMTEIQSYCQSSPPVPLSAVESGVVCLGSSASREGRYLRGVITQADGNVVKVYWADYGNDETKVVSELRAMPRQFTQLRIQASRVTLAGLSALKPVPGRAETIFRQKTEGSVLTGRFDKPRDQPAGAATGSAACLNQVELFDVGESVLEILIREGAYERRPGSAPVPRTPPVVAARRSASPPAEPPPLTPGTHAEVRVVSVTSVSSLHVRPLDTEPVLQQTLQRLTDALNVSACPLPMVRASEGSLCAVFKDASYQRGRVMSVGRRDMKVLYIDLGTSEIIPAGAAFALEQDVANYPPQAVHCCLSGLEMSHGTPELVEQLRALTAGGRLLCEVLDQLGEKRIVRLTDLTRSPPLDVGAMLRGMMSGARRVKQSPSKPPTAAGSPKPQPVAGSPKPAPAAVTVRPPEVELGRPEHISVVYVESAAAFFGQLLSADVDAMYDMEAAMQERYGGAVTPLRPAPVGAFCVGRSAINETFYRAKVLLSASDKVTIQYIDYGDQESKAPSEVFPLLPEFTKLPQLGMFCCLAGGESVPEDTFSRLVQDQTLLVLPVFGSGDHYRVTLPPCSENQPLLAQLKPFGIAAASVPPPKSPAATNGSLSSPSPRPPSSSPVATTGQPSETVKLTEPQLPVGLFKDVTVVHVVSPSEFYVRLREHSDSLARLEAELATYGTAAPAPVTPQQTVAVETAAGWRRGRVNGRKIDQVSVFLLDSGETVSAPMSSVRLLRSEHARLPAQAILCCAKGARPSGNGGWTDEETTQFRGSVAGRSFLARAEEARPGAPAVVTLAQAEPVRATALLHPGSGQQSPRSSDTNNNMAKRTSPPPRADQEVLQTIVHTVTSNGHGGVDLEKRCKLLDLLLKDPNWRDKSTAVPPPSASSGPGWRPSDSRPNGGLRAAERRSSGSSAPAPSPRPPKPSTTSAAAPAAPAAPEEDSEPRLERFVGKMRMDDPAEYAPVSRSSAGRGDGDSSSGRPSSRANGGDTRKPAPPAPARVEIPFHSATITRRPVPPGAPLAVTPTWVSGLARFYVQRCPAEPEFTSLMEEMQGFYSGLRAEDGQETQPQTGRPVAARFTDGAWYRALVRSVSPTELRVLFVDYGNCEVVPRREVKRLKEEHCRLPAQAYSCRFAGVEPAGGQWKTIDEKQLAKYFNGDMTVTASSDASGSVSSVEVTLSGQKVTDMLVADGLAVRPEPGQTLKQQHLGPFTGLPNPFRSGDKLAVFVSYIVSPDRLYCQLSERAADIEQLETQIETAVADGGKPLGGSAAAGAGCLAPFDGTFYRGVVVERTGDDAAAVHFVDYGNTETVPAAELLECPESLRRLPAQAIGLSLTGVPKDRADDLTARADQMEFSARVDLVSSDHLNVTLFDGETNVNVELGASDVPAPAAPAPTPAPAPAPTSAATPQKHLGPFTGLPNPFRSGDKLAVFVSYIVSPDRLYCQLSERAADIEQLETQIETAVADGGKPLGGSAAAGAGCLAPFDGTFYRGVVVERTGDDAAVHFVDYGNTETVPAAQLLECPESLRRLPAQAIRLSLTGVPKDRTDDLTARADQMEFSARVDLVSADHLNVTLFDGETNLNVELGASDAPAPAPTQAPTPAAPIPTPASVAPSPAPAATPSAPQKHLGPFTGLPNPFRLGDKLAVFVSYIVTPDRLYCQLSERAADIEQLETQIETAVADGGKPLGGSAAAGAGCLAPFDGTFYRGVVVERTGDDAAVHFVDYGNTETVPAAELLECPESLRRLPAQAIRLSLTGVPKDRTDDLTARADQMEFVARVDLASSDQLNVTLFDGETNVNVELGAADAPAPAPAAQTPAVAPAAPAPDEPQKTVTAPQAEQPSPAPESRPVAVSFTVSPGEFYVQDAAAADQLDELMARLETEYTKLADGERAVNEVQPGDLLAAPFSEDGAFYRARVLAADSSDTSQLHLQFIDYGNSERCARSACRLLTPPLLAPAPFAQRCRLAGAAAPAGGWTAGAAAALDTLTGAPDGQVKMVTVSGAGDCWTVKLIGLGGEDVAQALVEAGHATEESEKSDQKVTDAPTERGEEAPHSEPAAELAALTDLVPGRSVAVAVSFSLGPCEFWVQLLSNSARLDTLAEALEAAGELEPSGELPVAESPAAGQLVAVRYSVDCAMYRARLVPDSDSAESRRVLFVDYGNTESVPVGELRCLPPQLTEEPLLAARCSLPLRVAEGGETAAAERFAELADSELELQMTLVVAGDPAIVTLTHEDRDLAGVLVEEGLAVPVEVTQKTEETLEGKADTDGDTKVNQIEVNTGDSEEPATESRLEDPGDHEVFVSHVNSPLEFYVQSPSPDTTALDDLMERLAAAAASLAPAEPPFESTDLLAAPFSEDEALYRARVMSTGDDRARVQFVDYGNGEEVEAAALRRLPAELSELPPQALRCRLPVEACAASAVGRLRELTEEGARLTRLAASADADGPVALVRLTVDGRDVAETLAADGLCRLARRLTLPPALTPPLDTDMEASLTFVGTEEVFVMLSDDRTALGELRKLITELYDDADPPPTLAAPAASDLCVVQDTNGGWNRATVLTVGTENTARVRLVDTGYILEGVALSDLRQPLQAVALPPPLVHRCHPAPDCDSHRLAEAGSLDGLVTVRFTADGDRLMLHLVTSGTPAAPELVSSAGQTTEQPAAEEGTSPASAEVSAAGQTSEESTTQDTTTECREDESDSATTPRGRQYRDEKIVPGQISFSLIVPPTLKEEEPTRDSQVDRPTAAPAPAEQLTPAPAPAEQLTPAPVPAETQVATAPDGTPLGRRISHEFKIVPGQISFSLLSKPETKEDSEPTAEERSTGEKSQSVDGVEDAGEIDVETSKTESATPAKAGGAAADAVAEAMPEDAEIEAVPEDAAVEATPADAAEDEAMPEGAEAVDMPADAAVEATPADTEVEATPADTEVETTPADAEVKTTPAVAETEAMPADAAAEAKPEDAKVEATPADAEVQATSEDATSEAEVAEATPADSEVYASPADAEVSPIGGEVDVESSPVEAELEATSVEADADITLSDPEAEVSSAAVAEAGLVTVEAEEEFVSADEDDDMILVVSEEEDTPPGTEAEVVTTDGELKVEPCETGSAEVETSESMAGTTPAESAPVESTPTEPALAECTPTEASPAEAAPTEPTPTEPVPAETTPVQPTPAESVPAKATPDEARPTELTLAEAAPTESECTPAECTPTAPAQAEPTAPECTPAECTPSEAAPTEGAPAQATPAETTPVETSPAAENAPAEPSPKATQPETLAETTSPEAVTEANEAVTEANEAVAEANEAVAEATTVEAVMEATPTEASTEDALADAVIRASEALPTAMLMEMATEVAPEAATDADPGVVTGAAPEAVTEMGVRVETVIEAAPELVTGVASEAVTDATPETVTETSTEAVLEGAPKALTEAAPETATSATSETLAPAPKAEASPVAGHASMDAKVTTNEDATSAVSDKEDIKPLTVETAEEGTEPRPAQETEETVADVQEEPVVFVSDTLDNAVEDQVRSPDGQEETAAVAGGHDEPAEVTERPDDPSEKTVETSAKPAQPSGETVTSTSEERTEPSAEPVSVSGRPAEPIKTAEPTDESATTKEKVNPKPSKESPVLADDSNESPACADDSKESLVLADAPAEPSAGDPSAHSAETVKPSPEQLKGAAGRQGAGDSSSEARRPTEVGTDTVSDSGDADCV